MVMKEEVVLNFSNVKDRNDRFSCTIDVFPTSIGRRWFRCLWKLVEDRYEVKKDFMFLSFPLSDIPLSFWIDKHNRIIRELRDYFQSHPSDAHQKVEALIREVSEEELFRDHAYNPEVLFEIHHGFELAVGQVWAISDVFLQAPVRIKYLIRQLNDILHQIEWLCRGIDSYCQDPYSVSPSFFFKTFYGPQEELRPEDFQEFSLSSGFGNVYLKYIQSGKTEWEVFVEGDGFVDKKFISSMRKFSGQFAIDWGPTLSAQDEKHLRSEFTKWMKKRKLDDKSIGLGRIQVGKVRLSDFPSYDLMENQHFLSHYQNLDSIVLKKGVRKVRMDYKEILTAEGYDEKQYLHFQSDAQKSLRTWKTP